MQSLSVTFGLPLCISGITRSITFPNQMADHVRRRKAVMRRMRSPSRLGSGSTSEVVVERFPASAAFLSRDEVVDGIPAVIAALLRREIDGGDLSEWILDLCGIIPRPCTAKAA